MQKQYMRKTEFRRVCVAFENAIVCSRKIKFAKFPCDMFRCCETRRNYLHICPVYNGFIPITCVQAHTEWISHKDLLDYYFEWLSVFTKTFPEAKILVDEWDDFLKLDRILCEVCDGWNHEN